MLHIANQLNKVKVGKEYSGRTISADAAFKLLSTILTDAGSIQYKSIAVFGCNTGMLTIGTGLSQPKALTVIFSEAPEPVFHNNCHQFKVVKSSVVSKKLMPFINQSFDIAIVGPYLGKGKGVPISDILNATEVAKTTYALHKAEFKDKLADEVGPFEVCGRIDLPLPGSSHYSKNENATAAYNIVKITSKME